MKNSSERIVRWEEEHREWRLGGCCGKDFGETDEENLRIFGYVCMIYSFKALKPPFKKTYKKYRHYSLRCLELSVRSPLPLSLLLVVEKVGSAREAGFKMAQLYLGCIQAVE